MSPAGGAAKALQVEHFGLGSHHKIVFGENFMDMKINLHLEIHDVDVFYR